MPAGSEVLGKRTVRGEKALRVPSGLESLHPPLPLAGGLVGVFGPVVEVPVLSMLHARQDLTLGRAVALELIRDKHPWDILIAFEEVVYLGAADNVSSLLPFRLRGVNQPVISTRSVFLTPQN
jgi:hypothetical protein